MAPSRPRPPLLPPLLTVHDQAAPAALFRRVDRQVRQVGRNATYWKTFWFDLREPPANVVEELAVALAPRVPEGERMAGVEWWLGRMRTTDVLLDFHHDRDLRLYEETGQVRHPRFSSVFFLNPVEGGSLFVTDQRLKRRGGEWVLSPPEPGRFATARPDANRFVVFPGELLHGVLDARDQVPSGRLSGPRGPERWSVVLNWWPRPPQGVRPWQESRAYRVLASRPRR